MKAMLFRLELTIVGSSSFTPHRSSFRLTPFALLFIPAFLWCILRRSLRDKRKSAKPESTSSKSKSGRIFREAVIKLFWR